MKVYSWSDVPAVTPRPGAVGRNIDGEKMSISIFEMAAGSGADSTFHDHDNEQINYVLEGELEYATPDKVHVLKAGQVVVFPAYEPHRVRNMSKAPAKHLGILCPPRHGYPTK
jgi:quercetin dioxygenase-like cupin family protein